MNALMSYVSRLPVSSSLYRYVDGIDDTIPPPLQSLYHDEIPLAFSSSSSTPSSSSAVLDGKSDNGMTREVESREITPFNDTDIIDIKRYFIKNMQLHT
jgi:hypothetical protein